jgi:putative glycosyltransferase
MRLSKLSIVTTLYYSAPYLREFYLRVCRAADQLTSDYDITFVNDGSPDDSLGIARSLVAQDRRVRVIDLSRNYGHHKAIMTGLAHTTGDVVFLIDCDLEEEPEWLNRFAAQMCATEADVVYGMPEQRKGNLIERISGSVFFWLYNALSAHRVPPNWTIARLMTRRYVDALVQHRDTEIFLGGLWVFTGFLQVPVTVTKVHKGLSTYSFARKIAATANAITSFSNKPLVLIFYLGTSISALAGLAAGYLIVRSLVWGDFLIGWPSVIVSIWLLGGLMLFCQGMIGIYLAKVFMETKRRPYTTIRAVYEQTPSLVDNVMAERQEEEGRKG